MYMIENDILFLSCVLCNACADLESVMLAYAQKAQVTYHPAPKSINTVKKSETTVDKLSTALRNKLNESETPMPVIKSIFFLIAFFYNYCAYTVSDKGMYMSVMI